MRTEEGYIGKLVEYIPNALNYLKIDVGREIRHCDNSFDNFIYTRYGFQLKHSFNIIDLIEVGDYVNGYRVKEIGIYTEKEIVEIYAVCNNLKEIENKLINKKWYALENLDLLPGRNCKNDSIKSIVTKEMMKSVEYTIE